MAAPDEQVLALVSARHEEWDVAWRERHALAGAEALYHYTDAQGFVGIVQSRELWASNAAFLNDSTELTYVRGVLAEVAARFRDEFGVTAEIREYAIDAYAGSGRFLTTEAHTASVISMLESAPTMAGGMFEVYVSCFCEACDLLSQWRGYPSSGGGFALGLKPESLGRGGGLLRRVIYDEETQRRLLYDLLEPVVRAMASADPTEAKYVWDWLVREHLARIYVALQECSFCFKHPGFSQESEWRLVILRARDVTRRPNDPAPHVRATRAGLLPYVKRSLEPGAIAKVVVGPSSQPILAAEAAAHLLGDAGYEDARANVVHSAIPLRV